MKKIFIIFLFMIVLSLSLVLPSFAVMTDSFGSYTNLFDPSDVVQARFYTNYSDFQSNNFYSVNLDPDTTYTFISTKGSRSFYFGQLVSYNSYSSCFSFDSYNLLPISPSESRGGVYDSTTSDFSQTATTSHTYFKIQAFNGTSYVSQFVMFYPLLDSYQISFYKDSSFNSIFIGFNGAAVDVGTFFDLSDYPDGTYYLTINFTDLSEDHLSWNQILVSSDSSLSFFPSYVSPSYSDDLTYVYTIRTPSFTNSNVNFVIGINDVLSGSTSNIFSYNQSSENEFYLVEGSLTPDQIADVLQQDRFNQGYTQGYKEGEYDGMNSTSIFKSVILTVLSGPFVVVSNALNFDIFGINIYTFIQIILTILIVAFLITRLKGRE